jgi:hypothetical protein
MNVPMYSWADYGEPTICPNLRMTVQHAAVLTGAGERCAIGVPCAAQRVTDLCLYQFTKVGQKIPLMCILLV